MAIDANAADANLPIVWTGSTNWTNEQLLQDCNNAIIIQDQSLAISYTMEFEEMWGGSSLNPNLALSEFGPYKTDNTPHEFLIGGKRVENYFSPSDGTNGHIIQTVQNADDNLFFSVLVMTRTDVANAIANEASNNILTAGMVNDTGSQYSGTCFQTIAAQAGNQMMLYNGTYLLHHKYLIEDVNHTTHDPLVLTGSHNWSTSAETKNDENIVIVHDQSIANQYYQEFIKRFHDNGGVLNVMQENSELASFMAYPNPAHSEINVFVEMKKASSSEITLTDMYGSLLKTEKLFSNAGVNTITLDVRNFAAGIYLLNIRTGQSSTSAKIIIE